MLNNFIKKIWHTEGNSDINTPKDESAVFMLMYKNLTIGILSLNDGIWEFKYTEQFRSQNEIKPLIDFPDTSVIYKSNQLWPFFSYRIPGLNQPSVQAIISKEQIDVNNEVALLKKFGRFSIFNPFQLTASF